MNLTAREEMELLKKAGIKKDAGGQFKGTIFEFEIAYAALVARNADLEKFVRLMFQISNWPVGEGVHSDELQGAAVECNILIPETRYASCGEGCHCAEYHGDLSAGVLCFRKAKFLTESEDE